MAKMNCWEFKKCGRQYGGEKSKELGVCPAALSNRFDKIHGGSKSGRACWVLAGTLCGGVVQGTFAHKMGNCMACEFYKLVRNEEGKEFVMSSVLLNHK